MRLIRDVVRAEAQNVLKFRESGNGAIRILAYPLSKEADDCFGGLGEFDPEHLKPDDIPDYEVTFAITRDGSRVITDTWDGVEQKADCYAFSALKIAHCSRAQDLKKGLLSGLELGEPHLTEENGYGPYFGAICVEVYKTLDDGSLESWCGIYVCVSGADSKDDLKCAFAAIPVIKGYFTPERGFKTVCPTLPEGIVL